MADDMTKRYPRVVTDAPTGNYKWPMIQGIKPKSRGVGGKWEGCSGGSDSRDEVGKKATYPKNSRSVTMVIEEMTNDSTVRRKSGIS